MKYLHHAAVILLLATSTPAHTQTNTITVEQRIEAATRAIGYFEKSRSANDFQSVIATLSEINGPAESGAPLNHEDWRIRERQVKDTLGTWFLVFRAIDSLKLSLPSTDRCYFNLSAPGGFVGMDPRDVADPRQRESYQMQLDENDRRCEQLKFQLLLPRLNTEAQNSFRKAMQGFIASEGSIVGSHFAFALGKSNLTGERSRQVWAILDHANDKDWNPASTSAIHAQPDLNEKTKATDSDIKLWLRASDSRRVAWAAYYAARSHHRKSVRFLLEYIHKHAYDPVFELGADRDTSNLPEVRDAVDAMRAVLIAVIQLRATVPADDLLQLAPVLPDYVLTLSILPAPQETVLMNAFLTAGFSPRMPRTYLRETGASPTDDVHKLRWVIAGDVLANQASPAFARIVFDNFQLHLDYSVVSPNILWTGGGPTCVGYFDGDERGADWPPVGHYGLNAQKPKLVANPIGMDQINAPASFRGFEVSTPDSFSILTSGTPTIYLEHYLGRKYGFQRMGICKHGTDEMQAHWLEKLGVGECGKGASLDIWNPGVAFPVTPQPDHRAFDSYRIFTVNSDEQYHQELRNWIADQREVYSNIIDGMVRKRLVNSEQAAKALHMLVIGYDGRCRSVRNDAPCRPGMSRKRITGPPFPDLTPSNTQIEWQDRYPN